MAAQTAVKRSLEEPLLEGGIQHPWFVNGRLLTATDLNESREAERRQHVQLAEAIGAGVVRGFEVSLVNPGTGGATPTLSVGAGLALNRAGQAIELPTDVPELALARQAEPLPADAGLFAACGKPSAGPSPTGAGAYVLVVCPASGFRGKAPVRGFGPDAAVEGCGSRYAVEGVRFRLVELDWTTLKGVPATAKTALNALASGNLGNATNLGRLRNLLAHLCFGTEELTAFGEDPFALAGGASPFLAYGALDALRAAGDLTDCEVPLALLFWTTGGVRFVDPWAVRRRPIQPPTTLRNEPWPLHAASRRQAEAEACFLQFQRQIVEGLDETNPGAIRAKDRFRFLPAAGYLPIDAGEYDRNAFFADVPVTLDEVDPAFLRLILLQSWFLEPIDLNDPPPITVFESAQLPAYLVFLRGRKEAPLPQPAEPTAAPKTTTARPGQILIDVAVKEGRDTGDREFEIDVSASAGAVKYVNYALYSDIAFKDTSGVLSPRATKGYTIAATERIPSVVGGQVAKLPSRTVRVTVSDETGATYPVSYVAKRGGFAFGDALDALAAGKKARFATAKIPAGDYTVKVALKGFKQGSQAVTLDAGEQEVVSFRLVRDSGRGKAYRPPKAAPADWFEHKWYGKLYVLPKELRWPWPPPEERLGFDPVFDPPPLLVDEWTADWGDTLRAQFPDAPIDPGSATLYIDRTHTPDVTPNDAYAYLVFGDGGAYMPVLLPPADRALPVGVPVAEGGLAELDAADLGRLEDAGLEDLDVLAAGWSGLVEGTLGVGAGTAATVIGQARTQVDALQGSVQIFSGVDSNLASALGAAGFDSPVALANAEPAALAAVPNANLTAFQAEKLVAEARAIVPPSEWSLGAGGLGFSRQAVAELADRGVTTQAALKASVADATARAEVANVLGVEATAVEALAGSVEIKGAEAIKAELKEAAPVTSVTIVDRAAGNELANLGFRTVGSLANANAGAIAGAFGGDVAKANVAINLAKTATGFGL